MIPSLSSKDEIVHTVQFLRDLEKRKSHLSAKMDCLTREIQTIQTDRSLPDQKRRGLLRFFEPGLVRYQHNLQQTIDSKQEKLHQLDNKIIQFVNTGGTLKQVAEIFSQEPSTQNDCMQKLSQFYDRSVKIIQKID